MKRFLIALTFFVSACDTMPLRHMEEVELKVPPQQMSLSMEEQTEINLKRINKVAKAVGLKEKPCGSYSYSGHDISSKALTYGSRLLGTNTKNAQCFSICLEKKMTYMKENSPSCVSARAVAQVDPFDPQLIKVEMWTPVPVKESKLISQKMTELLLILKK